MKERPIIFSGDMVRAILGGRKTQTRRVVKPQTRTALQPKGAHFGFLNNYDGTFTERVTIGDFSGAPHLGDRVMCPYGQPGDWLWVRETCIISPPHWCDRDSDLYNVTDNDGNGRICQYIATSPDTDTPVKDYKLKITPSIHMPRWASRILLEVTDIRVERVQDISEDDAMAEGVDEDSVTMWTGIGPMPHRAAFSTLWDSINAKRGHGWDTNPWVWVVSFRVLEP